MKKIILITGASSGIGEGCARKFASQGARLILNARSIDKLTALAHELKESYDADCYVMPFDVCDRESAVEALNAMPEEWKSIDVLINNAGLAIGTDKEHEGNLEEWDVVIDTNIKALLSMTRLVVPGMVERGRGHIINIGSIAGDAAYPGGNVYCATKAAVKALSDGLRIDLVDTPLRVTNVKPGLVETNFSVVRFRGDKEKADNVYRGIKPLNGDDIAEVVYFAASAPEHMQVAEILVMPTYQATGTIVSKTKYTHIDKTQSYKMKRSTAFFATCLIMASCTNTSEGSFVDGVADALINDGKVNIELLEWTREPQSFNVNGDTLTITTAPHTDLWQRTYYHFRNDNAPVLQMKTREQYFSFVVKTDFTQSHHRFDQCGIVMYLDSDNWLKGSVEYENEQFQHLGSVATNNGYSDWATTAIPADVKTMWYRFSRRADDYCIECSTDGITFSQMRICHMYKGAEEISFGIYACSPEESSFTAVFTDMKITECMWKAHDGQQPDEE